MVIKYVDLKFREEVNIGDIDVRVIIYIWYLNVVNDIVRK